MADFGQNDEYMTPQTDPAVGGPNVAFGEGDPVSFPARNVPSNLIGAPPSWRLAVDQAKTPDDQLAVLRQLQERSGIAPDARWVRVGGEQLNPQTGTAYDTGPVREHLLYTHPETGKVETFDPEGFMPVDPGEYMGVVEPLARTGAYGLGFGAGAMAGGPAAGHALGVAASQGVKYGLPAAVEGAMGVDIPDSRSTWAKALERGIDAALEVILPPAGAKAGNLAQRTMREPLRRKRYQPRGHANPQAMEDLRGIAADQGIPEDRILQGAAPLVTESAPVRQIWQDLKRHPGASEKLQYAADTTQDAIAQAFLRAHRRTGGVTERYEAGRLIQGPGRDAAKGMLARDAGIHPGGVTGAIAKRNHEQEILEAEVQTLIGREAMIDAGPVFQYLDDLISAAKAGGASDALLPKVVPQEFIALHGSIKENGGKLGFGLLRDYRARIGPQARGVVVGMNDPRHGELKQLYGRISETLGLAARGKGGKAAAKWREAQTKYAETERLFERVRAVANAPRVEAAFQAAVSGAEKGPSMLRDVFATLDDEARQALVSLKLWEMGTSTTTAGARGGIERTFSPTQFARKWREMSPLSRKEMMDAIGKDGADLGTEWDRVARLSAAMEGAEGYINPSRTAASNVGMGMISKGLTSYLFGHKLARGTARLGFVRHILGQTEVRNAERQAILITDPDFVRWLGDGLLISNDQTGPTKWAKHLGALAGLAESKAGHIQDALLWYATNWSAALSQDAEATGEPVEQAN